MTVVFDPARYWNVVEDCLIEFHGLSRSEAKSRISDLHDWLSSLPPNADRDMIYHVEQFDLACDLVHRDLSLDELREQYYQIVDRHYPGRRSGYMAPSASA